ncbi:MAG: NADH-quinone oxidoreductase subunit L, partial [Pseudomonadota bacterium]
MIWYQPFFGHTDRVAQFYGIPLAGEAHGDEHAEEGSHGDDHGDESHGDEGHGDEAHGDGHGDEHHAAFGGAPGDGALYFAPDNTVLEDAHEAPKLVKVSPFIAMLIGLGLAYQFYIRRPDWPGQLAANQRHLYQFLLNKWYFDEIYNAVFVKPAQTLGGFLWKRGDGNVIDGGINGLA